MDALMTWGLHLIATFQRLSPALDGFFRAFTLMGEEPFYLLLFPLVYWCLDRRTGARLTVLLLLSAYTNALVKHLAALPRPADYAPGRVKVLWPATGYGFPSGHTQNAVAVWGYLALQVRRRWFWALAAVLMLFIPLSRIYLGVHFPHDVLGGYLIGLVLLLLYLAAEPALEAGLQRRGLAAQLALAFGAPLLLAVLFPTAEGVTASATLWGMGVGFALERRWVRFEVDGPAWQRALRLLLGGVVLVALWWGLRVAFAGLAPALLFRFLRYGLVGLWGSLGAPWAFQRLRLA